MLRNLEFIRAALSNVRSSHTSISASHKAYLDVIAEAARLLRGQLQPSDIDELLHTARYWALIQMTTPDRSEPVISGLLNNELEDRLAVVDETIATTRRAFNRWSTSAGHLVLPDTCFYLRSPRVLNNVDFSDILGTEDSITILFPLVVIEELDRAKRRNDAGRDKALVALAVLEKHAKDGFHGKWKSGLPSSPQGRGDVWFDVILDPPEHVPLGDPDAEIINRALAIQALSGRDVTLLTYDTSQAFRARGAGVGDVRKLDTKIERKSEGPRNAQ